MRSMLEATATPLRIARTAIVTASAFAAAVAWLRADAATPASANVPAGIRIPVALDEAISSEVTHRGDVFSFVTTKDENLGGLNVAAGTRGVGRVADVSKASKGHNGSLSLQADMLELSDGRRIWVNIAPGGIRGRYANRHVFPYVIPIPPLIFPGAVFTRTGDLILDKGTTFTVVTIPARATLAPLIGGPPTPWPNAAAMPPTARPSPAPSPSS